MVFNLQNMMNTDKNFIVVTLLIKNSKLIFSILNYHIKFWELNLARNKIK